MDIQILMEMKDGIYANYEQKLTNKLMNQSFLGMDANERAEKVQSIIDSNKHSVYKDFILSTGLRGTRSNNETRGQKCPLFSICWHGLF